VRPLENIAARKISEPKMERWFLKNGENYINRSFKIL